MHAAVSAELPSKTSQAIGTLLGFDFGERRIGVAVGDNLVGIAHPLQTIDAESNDIRFAAKARIELDAERPVEPAEALRIGETEGVSRASA